MLSKFHKLFDSLTRLERQIFQGALIIFALSSLLNGANAFYRKTVLAPIEGGSYTEGVVGQPIAINPLIAAGNEADRDLIELLFSDLSELMADYKLSDDQKSWTIELKENLFWSDGEPITADDVIFTVGAIQNPDTYSPLAQAWQSVAAEKLNEREFRFTLKIPYAFFLDNLRSLKIVPQHIFGAIPTANLRLSDYNLEPVGSGPYLFLNFAKRKDGFISDYRLRANQAYIGGLPLIQELRFKFFPKLEEAVAAFNRKEIDGLGGLSPSDLGDLKIGYQLRELNIPRYYAIFMNPSTAPALNQKEIREAIALVTDRGNLIQTVLAGRGIAIAGPLYPDIEGYDPEVSETARFSPKDAVELLETKGWRNSEGGIRVKKIGKEELKLEFEIIVPDIDFLAETVSILKEDLQKIGIRLTPITVDPSEVAGEIIKTRNYQMIIFGNILKNNPDVFSFWHSSERFHPGLNLALYNNKIVDGLLESIRKNFDDTSRLRDLKKLQNILTEEKPAIFLFSPNYLYAAPKDLGGFNNKIIAAPSNRFDDVNKWYLKTARVFK